MTTKEIYNLTKGCTNKEQIKSKLKGREREIAFDLLAQRKESLKRFRMLRDLNQLEDYLCLPLKERAEKYKLYHIAKRLTGMYTLRQGENEISTDRVNHSPFQRDGDNKEHYGRERVKEHFNKRKFAWHGGCYYSTLILHNVNEPLLFCASAGTFNNHTTYHIDIDFDSYTFKNIGGLTTFYLKKDENEPIKNCYWLNFYGSKNYSLTLIKGWLIKGYHAELKEDFNTAQFISNIEVSEIAEIDKLKYLKYLERYKMKKINNLFELVSNEYGYFERQKYLPEIKNKIALLQPFVPNTHRIKTIEDAIKYVAKCRSKAAKEIIKRRVWERLELERRRISRELQNADDREMSTIESGRGQWITRADSIKAGNCPSGTDAFIRGDYYRKLCEIYGAENVAAPSELRKNAIHISLLKEIAPDNHYVKRIIKQ